MVTGHQTTSRTQESDVIMNLILQNRQAIQV